LTGGADKHYTFGLVAELSARGVQVDIVGSDELDDPSFHRPGSVKFLNLRGNQDPRAGTLRKFLRVTTYYLRLLRYAAKAEPPIFHILWNNRFEYFDRTLLLLYYKLMGKRLAFTAHNVNAGQRDSTDSLLNRLTLRAQYRLVDHVFVHTTKMKEDLHSQFGVPRERVSTIPYGINNAVPVRGVSAVEAKRALGLAAEEKAVLFFGRITPYKGLEYLVRALADLDKKARGYRLIVAGTPHGHEDYWGGIRQTLIATGLDPRVIARTEFIPEEEIEVFFKAADVLVLPYTDIFQSGVLILSYSFGLPVVSADVGSLGEYVLEGRTGCLFKPRSHEDLAAALERYFGSELYANLDARRADVQAVASERHSWNAVGEITCETYQRMVGAVAAESRSDQGGEGGQRTTAR
jgi:glycosyltransferase involved in cell wall biosynthesis